MAHNTLLSTESGKMDIYSFSLCDKNSRGKRNKEVGVGFPIQCDQKSSQYLLKIIAYIIVTGKHKHTHTITKQQTVSQPGKEHAKVYLHMFIIHAHISICVWDGGVKYRDQHMEPR